MASDDAPRPTRVVAPRATRILRAGPPPRGRWMDIVVGVVGLLMLLSTAYFAVALPKFETPPPIYQVTFKTEAKSLDGASFDFAISPDSSRRHDFSVELPADNVLDVTIAFHFTDDLAASKPDQFIMELYDNNDAPGGPHTVVNAPAVAGPTPGSYVAQLRSGNESWSASSLPDDFTVEDKAGTMTLESVTTQAQHDTLAPTQGTWRLHVQFRAGNCVTVQEAGGDPEVLQRAAACAAESRSPSNDASPQDQGNNLTIDSFTYRYFEPVVERIQ